MDIKDKNSEIVLDVARSIVNEIAEQWIIDEEHTEEFKKGLRHSINVIDIWLKQQGIEQGLNKSKTSLYDKFQLLKEFGKLKPFDEISEEELYKLFLTENLPDSVIARLFNVQKKDVTKKRYKYGIKLSINPIAANILFRCHTKE
ncbi:hypothetical protein KM915_10285 [Cytobacillus oceanisediminis]|uniref:hypothetical protein n=1 Tax=Cytobacillus oceanisediminis TaxID=665099 RepID=UPI001C2297B5|nr:hypothetical protein [Cytobacillus oceanisediminis]MBU8730441.1 hypothetical protein [Cytobacillus oceanisediminis]